MTGVPATTDMHFRNGAVAISYMSTLLLTLVDEQKITLDDILATWLPDFPHAVAVSYAPAAFSADGNYSNSAEALFRKLAAVVSPGDAPPTPTTVVMARAAVSLQPQGPGHG